ncbi:SCO family protein [Planococcus sp. N028]|uniref:SCO family protein n=1 Tax=Planococcus shixiaomingii TaxID=3058393 RepID=A0ABT8N603_9BACL|nr:MULTISPECIES: SCO family protein [unclassified Planococcus (in: firmicutes)]MDN7243169.1 SCO family protein [Planococcus sp. N028]WKA55113.1 SCO family protein [Planococcus sp. N022]
MRKNVWLFSLLLFTLLLSGCGQSIKDPLNWELQDFTFTNQENEKMGLADLKGEVWLADFVFTNCTTVCLPMMANMTDLQEQLKKEGLDVKIVSFTADPAYDSPEVLKSYAENYGADLSTWSLLTGYSPETIDKFAMENFKTIARKPADQDQAMHGTSFFLVDKNGVVMKDYDGLKPPVDDIIADAKILVSEE